MRIAAFTSATASYLPNARILAGTIRRHQPDWDIHLLMNDRTPDFIRWEDEPFDDVTFAEWLYIGRNWNQWAFNHSVVELCTATKGVMSQHLLGRLGYDAVVYLDPDTMVFSPLTEVANLLSTQDADIVLTPHLTDRESTREAVVSHELAALKHGTFNLGFFAIANTENGLAFVDWWTQRLADYCHIDFDAGLFTDQKWCNLVPYMFQGVAVICSRAYNVATWNATNRPLSQDAEGTWRVAGGELLRFYHFSGFGNDFAWAKRELAAFTSADSGERAIWRLYMDLYEEHQLPESVEWHWGKTLYGSVTAAMRDRTRQNMPINPYKDFRVHVSGE